jgi:hypothetical protein
MAFDINKVPMPGTAEADVSALHHKLSHWLDTAGKSAAQEERGRIQYVADALADIQAQMFRERQAPLGAAILAAPAHGSPDDDPLSSPTIKFVDEEPAPAPNRKRKCIDCEEDPRQPGSKYCEGCEPRSCVIDRTRPPWADAPTEIQLTWSDVQPGDEVYSEVDGRWWEVSEVEGEQVTIANADAGRTITFTPESDALIRVRRGTIGTATDALVVGGLTLGAA